MPYGTLENAKILRKASKVNQFYFLHAPTQIRSLISRRASDIIMSHPLRFRRSFDIKIITFNFDLRAEAWRGAAEELAQSERMRRLTTSDERRQIEKQRSGASKKSES